ncbi:MAG: hypothetical protein KAT70_01005, partial [Thermoplasmata archaeon]|nr:hypothetical protein [Thermoplasmata archaeon]
AQGYGLVDVDKAIAISLALEELRKEASNATVWDAYRGYSNMSTNKTLYREERTDALETSWHGEWGQASSKAGGSMETDQRRLVYIPPEATKLVVDLQYAPISVDQGVTVGQLTLTYDSNLDNQSDWTAASVHEEIDISGQGGGYWAFDVEGQGFSFPFGGRPSTQFREARMEYDVKLRLVFSPEGNDTITVNATDLQARVAQWDFSTPENEGNTTILLETAFYDLNALYVEEPSAPPPAPVPGMPLWPFLLILAMLGTAAYVYKRKRTKARVPTMDIAARAMTKDVSTITATEAETT